MPKRDYYDILGVSRTATEKEILKAFRKLARQHHPDVNPGDKAAETRFKEASEAYDVLSDAEKRKKYDRFGQNWQQVEAAERTGATAGGTGRAGGRRRGAPNVGGFNFDDGDVSSIFETLFSGSSAGRDRRRGPQRGGDLDYPVTVSLEEAFSGTLRALQLQRGELVSSIEVRVPPGVTDATRVRVEGKGHPGSAGGKDGDLYLVVSVQPHTLFRREGNDLFTTIDVPLTTAVLGGEIDVPTLKGTRLKLKLPTETQNSQRFRLARQGMPILGGHGHGDLFADVRVQLPAQLSPRARELFEELAALQSR